MIHVDLPAFLRARMPPLPLRFSGEQPCSPDLRARQMVAYLEFSDRLDRIERANGLMVAAVGAQGDQKAVREGP